MEAAEIGRRQDESEAARKQLIELSREFKKSASEVYINLMIIFHGILSSKTSFCFCYFPPFKKKNSHQ